MISDGLNASGGARRRDAIIRADAKVIAQSDDEPLMASQQICVWRASPKFNLL